MIDANPYAIKSWLEATTLTAVIECEEYQLAKDLFQTVEGSWAHACNLPRWAPWYDQLFRASLSVLTNLAESFGKSKGWSWNASWVVRGEAYECYALCDCGPEWSKALLPRYERLITLLNTRLHATPYVER